MKIAYFVFLALASSASANAEVVRLQQGQTLGRFSNLIAGTQRYVRYKIALDGSRTLIDVWERRISFTPATKNARGRMRIEQRWDSSGLKPTLFQDSWFEVGTFKPLTHVRRRMQDGSIQVRGFQFSDRQVAQLDGLTDNAERDFHMPLVEPTYNFETDMELLQALPLASGRTFDIPFYDAGIDKKPDRYLFKVVGPARIAGVEGRPVDTWLVTADYHTGRVLKKFWFAKNGQRLISEETLLPDGTRQVKALLPPEPDDANPTNAA